VAKQDVHIRDLPPEVRRSFLLSMVFFPAVVGGGVCGILFLGWWFLREPKKSAQYALELREGMAAGGNRRSRWKVAREVAENKDRPEVLNPDVLAALLEIVQKPELDEDVDVWSPSDMLRSADERRTSVRVWAAYLSGFVGGRLNDPDGRAAETLVQALNEPRGKDAETNTRMRLYTAQGLALLKDLNTAEALIQRLQHDPDVGVRAACAYALGAVGWYHFTSGAAPNAPALKLEQIRAALREAYQKDHGQYVTWNTAIALARLKDDTGRQALEHMLVDDNPETQQEARKALDLLDGVAPVKKSN